MTKTSAKIIPDTIALSSTPRKDGQSNKTSQLKKIEHHIELHHYSDTLSKNVYITNTPLPEKEEYKTKVQILPVLTENSTCSSLDSSDHYAAMKQKLVNKCLFPSNDIIHLTERDVQKSFDTEKSPGVFKKAQYFLFPIGFKTKIRNSAWWSKILLSNFPFYNVVRHYEKQNIFNDIAAGLSVGVASIPMGMSYALLAGLPPVHGLYNNLIFPLIYMLLGTQPQVCVGTSAIEAMMVSDAITRALGEKGTPSQRVDASIGLALIVGIILTVLRVLGIGAVARFLADPVLSGFSTGSAIIIGTSQLKHVFGLNVPAGNVLKTWWFIITHLHKSDPVAIGMTIGAILLLVLCKKANKIWFKKFPLPASFFLMILFVLLNYLIVHFTGYTVDIIGNIPQGFPKMQLFSFDSTLTLNLIEQGLWYSCFYFVIHITIAKTIAQQRGTQLNASQEAFACGITSIVGSFFQCFPVATSLSRTSISYSAGAATCLYNLTNALVVGLTLTIITPLLTYLPKAVLSSVVLFGVHGMMFFRDGLKLCVLFLPDFILWFVCCCAVVFWGAMEGVIVAVLLSLIWIIKKNAFPNVVVLGRLPGTSIYRNIERFRMAEELEGCKILRFDASLNFSNADQFETTLHEVANIGVAQIADTSLRENAFSRNKPNIRVIIIDAASINDMDMTAVRMLKLVAKKMEQKGIVLLFANWKGPMRDFLERTAFYASVPPEHCFLSLHDAVLWADLFYLNPGNEKACTIGYKSIPDEDVPTLAVKKEWSTECVRKVSNQDTLVQPFEHAVHFITESAPTSKRVWPIISNTSQP